MTSATSAASKKRGYDTLEEAENAGVAVVDKAAAEDHWQHEYGTEVYYDPKTDKYYVSDVVQGKEQGAVVFSNGEFVSKGAYVDFTNTDKGIEKAGGQISTTVHSHIYDSALGMSQRDANLAVLNSAKAKDGVGRVITVEEQGATVEVATAWANPKTHVPRSDVPIAYQVTGHSAGRLQGRQDPFKRYDPRYLPSHFQPRHLSPHEPLPPLPKGTGKASIPPIPIPPRRGAGGRTSPGPSRPSPGPAGDGTHGGMPSDGGTPPPPPPMNGMVTSEMGTWTALPPEDDPPSDPLGGLDPFHVLDDPKLRAIVDGIDIEIAGPGDTPPENAVVIKGVGYLTVSDDGQIYIWRPNPADYKNPAYADIFGEDQLPPADADDDSILKWLNPLNWF